MIRMRYPQIDDNPLCDGEVHIIIPIRVSRINNLPLYYVEYYDRKTGSNAYTIMRRSINGMLTKLPLLDYEVLNDMIDNNRINFEEENVESFFSRYVSGADYIDSASPVGNFVQLINSISNPSIDDKKNITNTLMAAAPSGGGNPPNNPSKNSPTIVQTQKINAENIKSQTKSNVLRIIELYIDSKLDIYFNQYGKYVRISNAMLFSFMQHFGIVWHIKDLSMNNSPKKDMINGAINKYFNNFAEWREVNKDGDAHFYTVMYSYNNKSGFGK